MSETLARPSIVRLVLLAVGCLALGFAGGVIGSSVGSDSAATPESASTVDVQMKGAAVTTTKPRTATTLRPGVIAVPTTFVIRQGTGVPGPVGPPGPAGPAGRDGRGVEGIQWIEVGGEFTGCCGEWLASCPVGTTAMTWEARGLAGADIGYAGRSIYSDNPNDWMFRAGDDRATLDFTTPVARFALGCLKIG